jgi:hypothetical protein
LLYRAQEVGAVNLKRIWTLFGLAQRQMVSSGIIPMHRLASRFPGSAHQWRYLMREV